MEDIFDKANGHGTPSGKNSQSSEARTSSEGAPKKKRKTVTEDLRKDIEEQKQLAQNNYEKFLRAYAELENYKKRAEKDKADNLKYANEEFLRDLLPFVDNLQRAVDHASAEKNKDADALIEGVELTLKDLIRILEKHGLQLVDSIGKHFDPNLHEAMMQVESGAHEPQTVVEEFQKGYLIKDRLLRPARVSVAVKPEPGEEEKPEGKERSSPSNHETSE
jgi:molecular chaperone GrpE